MAPIAVSHELQEQGTITFHRPFSSKFHGVAGSDNIHSVDLRMTFIIIKIHSVSFVNHTYLQTRYFVPASEVLCVGGATLSRSPHSVLVIFANEYGGKVPQLGLGWIMSSSGTHIHNE